MKISSVAGVLVFALTLLIFAASESIAQPACPQPDPDATMKFGAYDYWGVILHQPPEGAQQHLWGYIKKVKNGFRVLVPEVNGEAKTYVADEVYLCVLHSDLSPGLAMQDGASLQRGDQSFYVSQIKPLTYQYSLYSVWNYMRLAEAAAEKRLLGKSGKLVDKPFGDGGHGPVPTEILERPSITLLADTTYIVGEITEGEETRQVLMDYQDVLHPQVTVKGGQGEVAVGDVLFHQDSVDGEEVFIAEELTRIYTTDPTNGGKPESYFTYGDRDYDGGSPWQVLDKREVNIEARLSPFGAVESKKVSDLNQSLYISYKRNNVAYSLGSCELRWITNSSFDRILAIDRLGKEVFSLDKNLENGPMSLATNSWYFSRDEVAITHFGTKKSEVCP